MCFVPLFLPLLDGLHQPQGNPSDDVEVIQVRALQDAGSSARGEGMVVRAGGSELVGVDVGHALAVGFILVFGKEGRRCEVSIAGGGALEPAVFSVERFVEWRVEVMRGSSRAIGTEESLWLLRLRVDHWHITQWAEAFLALIPLLL